MKKTYLLFILFSVSLSAQIKGVVKDSLSGKPIPYVSVWVENENIGTTTEENGEFAITTANKEAKLIFSAIGFEEKRIVTSKVKEVFLNPTSYQLDELVFTKGTKQIEIGKISKDAIYQAFESGPNIDVKYFPYDASYKATPHIKQVTLFTDSKIENASIKLHFYKVNLDGSPGEELLKKELLVTLKKGVVKIKIDVTSNNLKIPKEGIFVGFEKLIIEKNKVEKTITNKVSNTTTIYKTYLPYVLYGRVEKEFSYSFLGGKWVRQQKENSANSTIKTKINEPAINLILTN